jgi:LPS-assembly lipoprotein
MTRYRFAIAIALLALAGCGFHPRGQYALPADVAPLRVEGSDAYNPLALGLTRMLERSGNAASNQSAASVLKITGEAWENAPISIDQFAQVREYSLRYRVDFVLQSADGQPRTEPQSIELRREYAFDQDASAGSPAEQELIRRELQRDMEAAILRRLDVLLRPKP